MQGDAPARRDFVAQYQSCDELAAVRIRRKSAIEQRQQCRQNRDAGMPLGQHVAVVGVHGVDGGGAGKRGACQTRAPAIEQNACIAIPATKLRGRIGVGDRRGLRRAPGCGDCDQIAKTACRLLDDIRRQRIER
jgi:hypothetical protein